MKQSSQPAQKLLTEKETAVLLGLSVSTLRKWRVFGRPPGFVKLGRAVRYEALTIEALLEDSRRTNTTGEPSLAVPDVR